MKSKRAMLLVGFLLGVGAGFGALAADLWTTKDGMTVYTFDNDPPGKSVCGEPCLKLWTPVAPDAMKGKVDAISRDDGSKQAAVNGKALYRYVGDKKAGDTTGNGFKGIWHVLPAPGKTSQAGGGANSSPGMSY